MNDKVKQVRVINAKTYRKLNPNDPDWIGVTKEIKASPLLGSQILDEFLSYLPVETIEAIWFCIRYDYKIMDEDMDYDSEFIFAGDDKIMNNNTLIPFEDVAEHFTVVEGYGDELTHDNKEEAV